MKVCRDKHCLSVAPSQTVETDLPESLKVLHRSRGGKVETVIIRGSQEAVSTALAAVNPIFYDLVPLTLEEVFVYELGGVDYEVKNVIL